MDRRNCASGSRSFMESLPAGDGHKRRFGGQLYGLWGLLEKGDHTAVMLPNYLQTWGLARAYGKAANAFTLWSEWKAPGCAGRLMSIA